jgi:hypothetical protein
MPAGSQHPPCLLTILRQRNNNNNNNNNIMVSLKGVKVSILLFSIAAAATPGDGDEPVDSPSFSKRELRSGADDAMSKSSLPDVIIGASESKRSLLSYGPYGPPGSNVSIYNTCLMSAAMMQILDKTSTHVIYFFLYSFYPTVSCNPYTVDELHDNDNKVFQN